MSAAAPSISARGLSRRFGHHVAVEPVDLDVYPGRVTGLLGPNGSGKSTLMRMLIGLVPPTAGSATVAGEPLSGDGTRVRRRVTYAPGEIGVYGELRGREHLAFLLRGREREAVGTAVRIAEELGLPLGDRVRTYSHGMKRQLLFSAALAPDVPVRILDEPTEGLDPTKRGRVLELLTEDAARGRTILLSSHHLLEVDRACERLVFVNEGRIVGDEDAASLRERAMSLVKVGFGDGHDLEALGRGLRALGPHAVHRNGSTFDLVLELDDPRSFLTALAASDLPPPQLLAYGTPSLHDLYRDLYGVEGV